MENKQVTLEAVLKMLETERFQQWYEGKFVEYIGGAVDPDDPTKQDMLEDLAKMLRV